MNKKGEVVSDPRHICLHYLRGWFILDLVAALPFDLIYASEVSDTFRVSNDTAYNLARNTFPNSFLIGSIVLGRLDE